MKGYRVMDNLKKDMVNIESNEISGEDQTITRLRKYMEKFYEMQVEKRKETEKGSEGKDGKIQNI